MEKLRCKRRSNRALFLLLLGAVFLLFLWNCGEVKAASRGFVTINGNTYYVKEDGSYQKGFLTLNGSKYYFNSAGVMAKGWQYDGQGRKIRFFNTITGKMKEGYAKDSKGNIRYFRRGTGLLARGYLTNSNGQTQYFQEEDGCLQKGWMVTGGKLRYFDAQTGYMKTGWVTSGNYKRYFNPVKPEGEMGDYGVLCTGIQRIGGYYYYFTPATTLAHIRRGGGLMVNSGFTKVGNYTYYFNENGTAEVGWMTLEKKLYYFNAKGQMYRNTTQTISGKTYKFDSQGVATSVDYPVENGLIKIVNYGRIMYLYPAYLEIPGIADGSVDDVTVLAAIADREAGNQGVYGMMAVCMVILNRSLDENTSFPADFRQVIFQSAWQFNEDASGSFAQFEKRLQGSGWHSEASARKAATLALYQFNRYKTSKAARTIPGFKNTDFDYLFFMTPAAFYASGVNQEKVNWEQYRDHVFFDQWA